MKKTAFVMLLAMLFCISSANAVTGWTASMPIAELNQQPANSPISEQVIVSTTGFVGSELNSIVPTCSAPTSFYFTVGSERQKRMFAMLLSAQMSGRNVRVSVTGACSTWGSSEIDGVLIN